MAEVWQSPDGVWTTNGQDVHLNVPQLLKICDLPDTRENRELAVKIAVKLAAERWPDAQIIARD